MREQSEGVCSGDGEAGMRGMGWGRGVGKGNVQWVAEVEGVERHDASRTPLSPCLPHNGADKVTVAYCTA